MDTTHRYFSNPGDRRNPTQIGRNIILVQLLKIEVFYRTRKMNSIHQLKEDSLVSPSTGLKQQQVVSNGERFK
jgi:hypothetical protein